MAETWIYRYEVKGIQSYILATDKLKQIKGGSSLIEKLGALFGDTRTALGLTKGAGVQELTEAVAGGATIEVPDSLAGQLDSLMAIWPMLVARHAPGLQLVQARVRGPRGQKGAWEELQGALRAARSRIPPDLPEAGPLVLRAPRTGLPAVGFDTGEKEAVDAASQRRLEAAKRRKGDGAETDDLGDRIGKQWEWIEDLDEIGHSYVGVLHADGNDLGNRIKQLVDGGKADELKKFSTEMSANTLAAVRAAVEQVLVPAAKETKDGKLPGRPIVVGGDDVAFVLRGDLALPFARSLLEQFHEKHKRALGGPLEATAGLALVHRHHPFRAAHDLAEELCKFAKGELRGKGTNGVTPSSLAFYRLTTSMSGSWKEVRERELAGSPPPVNGTPATGWLTLCPYRLEAAGSEPTLAKLEALVEALRHRDLPLGSVREWLNLLRTDPARAEDHLARFRQVQQQAGRDQKAALGELEEALGELGASNGWREVTSGPEPVLATPIADALAWLQLEKGDDSGGHKR